MNIYVFRRLALLSLLIVGFFGAVQSAQGQAMNRPQEIDAKTEKAIQRGIEYLISQQNKDGSWTSGPGGQYPVAMTGLAGLALLAGGHTPVEGKYAPQVRKAVQYVLSNADPKTGHIAVKNGDGRSMYGHGFCTLFLGEVYGMVRSKEEEVRIRVVLEKAVVLIQRSQSERGGWFYSPDDNTDEGSVTITQIQALRSVRNSGIKVPKQIIDKACKYIKLCQLKDGSIAYSYAQRNHGNGRPALTAAAVAVMYSAGQYEHPVAKKCLENLVKLIKSKRNEFGGHSTYANLYASQAMYLSGEENWKLYYPKVFDFYKTNQAGDGSWRGDGVGPVYGTSVALLVMQLPYKRLPILQR